MWPWRRPRMSSGEEASSDESDDAEDRRSNDARRRLRRRAGCIWGCLTEPIVLAALTLGAVAVGRAYLARRARLMREQQDEEDDGNVSI